MTRWFSIKYSVFLSGMLVLAAASCKKNEGLAQQMYQLSYGDSIFYLKNQSLDYMVSPVHSQEGTYTSFPDGLELDKNSGVINVSKSEAGMRYRIRFTSASGDSSTTFVVISGINFPDKYYFLSKQDSIAFPVYNADASKTMPSGIFDEDSLANNSGCAMKTINGQINLAESIRRGLFGATPQNDVRKDFEIKYRLNDKSGKALNKIKVLLYYYDSMNDVPPDLKTTVAEHLAMTFQPDNTPVNNSLSSISATKPRPPCIVIIAH